MANTADNQAGRDDVAAAAVGEGVMKQLYDASGGAKAERVDIDKAVALGILDKTKAALLLGSEVEGDFKRAYGAEKASRKPSFEAFKAALNAVYGKVRFEAPAVSERAVPTGKKITTRKPDGSEKIDDEKRQSPLVAAMARVLKHNEGLSGEGANFDGHPALRVMACAMDDVMLEREEAVSRIPGLEAAMENARYDLQQAKDRAAAIDKTREAATELTDGNFERGVPGKFREAYKGLWGKRFIAAELGAKEKESKAAMEKLEAESAKYWANMEKLRDDFVKLRDLADTGGEAKLKDDLDGIVRSLDVYLQEKDESKAADIGKFLGKDVTGVSEKLKKSPLAQREDFRKLREGGKYLERNLLIVSQHHTLHDAIDAQARLDQEKADAEAAIDAYVKQVGPVKTALSNFSVQARKKKNPEVADATKNALDGLTDLASKIKQDPTGWEQFLNEDLNRVVAVLEENDVGAKQTIAKFGSQIDGLIGGAKVVKEFHEASNEVRRNAGILADGATIEGEMDGYMAELDAVKSGLSTIVAAAKTSGERPVLADAALKKVEAFLENLGTDEAGWKEFVEDELPEAMAELGDSQAARNVDFQSAIDSSKRLSDERGILSDFHTAKERWQNFSARAAAAKKVVDDRYDVLNGEGREELLGNVFAVAISAQTFTSRVLKIAAPELVELCEEYVGKSRKLRDRLKVVDEKEDEYVTTEDLLKFGDETTAQFLTEFKSRFAVLGDVAKAEVTRAEGAKELLDTELETARNLEEQEDPERKVLHAAFPGMEIGDDGKIKMHGFDFNSADDVAAILEKFDGRKDEAGNVVEVGILPWFGNSKNIGTLRGGIGRLKELGKKMTQVPFLTTLNKYVQDNSTMDLTSLQRRLESEIRVHQSRVLQESKPEDVNKEVERQLGMQSYTKSEENIREEIKDRDEEAVRKRSLKDGELSQLKADVDETIKLAGEFHEKMSELIAHLSVIVNAGVKLKNAGGIEIDFNKIKTEFGGVSKVDVKGLADVYGMFGGLFDNDSNIRNLVSECRGVKESVKAVTSKETAETAKKVVAEMLAQQGIPLAQINDLATAIIRDGVGIMATKKDWLQVARECQPKALENLQALAFRDKLCKFKMKKGEKESTPFASLKPENFADQKATEKTLKNLELMKGRDWLLEYGFIIMAAFKVFEGDRHVKASGQGVVIEKYLKNVLAEKWLDKHPEFDSVDKAMMDSDFVKLINEEFDKRFERGAARFGEFSNAYDASAQGMKMKLALQIDRKIKVLKAKRKAKTVGEKEYNQQFTALLEQAEEEGVRGMLKEVSPRWKVSKAAAMSGLWNNDFMLGVRGVRENAADWLKTKSTALGLTTAGGIIKGGFESAKRLGFGAIAGGVMAPIGIVRWTGSFLKNLVLGRWKFASTRALIGSDFGVAGKFISGGLGKAFTDTAAYTKGMVAKVMQAKSDDAKAKRKAKAETGLKLAESDDTALKGKTELDAVEVPDEPYKDITASFEKRHAALAERKKPDSMRQERPSGHQERLAA